MLHVLPQCIAFSLPSLTQNNPNSVRIWPHGATDRTKSVMDEKRTLCQRAKCPRSEPLLFTGSPLIPVRGLSASGLIWAGFPLTRTAHPLHSTMLSVSVSFPYSKAQLLSLFTFPSLSLCWSLRLLVLQLIPLWFQFRLLPQAIG